MKNAYDALLKVYRSFGVLLVLLLIAVVLANIVFREGFGIALVWANEFAITLFVWIAFIGAGVSFAENARIRFSIFMEALPRAGFVSIDMLVTYVGLVLLVGLLATSVYVGYVHRDETFATMPFSIAWQWASVPVGTLLAILGWIRHGTWTPSDAPTRTPGPIEIPRA
jgi:TRAP-type C4-dicarboxylate transport system permease small subunit